MNSPPKSGRPVAPPASPRFAIVVKPPDQIKVTQVEGYTANPAVRSEVPVFPAAGKANPPRANFAPVPLFKKRLSIKWVQECPRGSSTACVSGAVFFQPMLLSADDAMQKKLGSARNTTLPPNAVNPPRLRQGHFIRAKADRRVARIVAQDHCTRDFTTRPYPIISATSRSPVSSVVRARVPSTCGPNLPVILACTPARRIQRLSVFVVHRA